jgi:hypothetical protein
MMFGQKGWRTGDLPDLLARSPILSRSWIPIWQGANTINFKVPTLSQITIFAAFGKAQHRIAVFPSWR